MKRILSLTTMLLFTIASFAYDAKINGIYYNTGEKIGEASVTYGDEYYSGDVVIPSSFYNGKPWTVTSIGAAAFKLCWNLASVTVPRSVTSIGACAFEQSGLTSITIPNSVTSIGIEAFCSCKRLASVTIPNSVTCIGQSAFYDCPNLVTIYNEAINPQVLTGDPGFDESTTVHVPEGSKDSYKNADYWKDFSNIVDDIPTAINNVSGNVYLKVKSNFSIDGKSISQPQKGMNIQKMSDGTTIKVLKD